MSMAMVTCPWRRWTWESSKFCVVKICLMPNLSSFAPSMLPKTKVCYVCTHVAQLNQFCGNVDGQQDGANADYIEFHEFRTLLWYLRQYFEYWVMFNRIDTSQDRRLSFAEFKLALAEIRKWGVVVDDARTAFAEVDEDGMCFYVVYLQRQCL